MFCNGGSQAVSSSEYTKCIFTREEGIIKQVHVPLGTTESTEAPSFICCFVLISQAGNNKVAFSHYLLGPLYILAR